MCLSDVVALHCGVVWYTPCGVSVPLWCGIMFESMVHAGTHSSLLWCRCASLMWCSVVHTLWCRCASPLIHPPHPHSHHPAKASSPIQRFRHCHGPIGSTLRKIYQVRHGAWRKKQLIRPKPLHFCTAMHCTQNL